MMLIIMKIINFHNMNTFNNETKHDANDTQFCNLSFMQYKYREYKKIELDAKHA